MFCMKKIAFITTTFENTTNGPSKFAKLLHEDALKFNKNIIFYTEDTTSFNSEYIFKVNIPKNINIVGLGFIYRVVKYFDEVSKNKDIGIVVVNNTMYGFLFYFFSNKNVIGFINDDEHIGFKWELSYKTIRSYIFSIFERFSLRKNKLTIANSFFLKKRITNFYKKEFNIKVLYKGIKMDEELNLQKHNQDSVFKILFVKTNFNIGGLSTLLKALKGVKNVHLDIVTSQLVMNADELKMIKKIDSYNLYHKLPQNKVFGLMKKAHCFCTPSRKEALGVANMEAMLYSCLVIGTNVGGIPEVLNYGKVGVIIEKDDAFSLREKIEFIKKNRNLRKRMVINAHEHVKKFSINESIINFYKIINE